jgi:hypothetical protein
MKSATNAGRAEFYYPLAFGLFLGLTIWKFGNPVILDNKVSPPSSLADFWNDAWPPHWANLFLIPFAIIGFILAIRKRQNPPTNFWLWLLPLIWFGWQLITSLKTVDADLTTATLWQFAGCLIAYFAGWFLFADKSALNLLLIGILLAFTYCLVEAVLQKNYEFPQSRQMLLDGEMSGWTNFPPATLAEMKNENIIIATNGVAVANPAILAKFSKGRVNGTLVYPNALAGLILMLLPVALVIAFKFTGGLKSPIRWAAILMSLFLGGFQSGMAARHWGFGYFLVATGLAGQTQVHGGHDRPDSRLRRFCGAVPWLLLRRSHQRGRPVRLLAGGGANHGPKPGFRERTRNLPASLCAAEIAGSGNGPIDPQ